MLRPIPDSRPQVQEAQGASSQAARVGDIVVRPQDDEGEGAWCGEEEDRVRFDREGGQAVALHPEEHQVSGLGVVAVRSAGQRAQEGRAEPEPRPCRPRIEVGV